MSCCVEHVEITMNAPEQNSLRKLAHYLRVAQCEDYLYKSTEM